MTQAAFNFMERIAALTDRPYGTDMRACYLILQARPDCGERLLHALTEGRRAIWCLTAMPVPFEHAGEGASAWVSPQGQAYNIGYGGHDGVSHNFLVPGYDLETLGWVHVSGGGADWFKPRTPAQYRVADEWRAQGLVWHWNDCSSYRRELSLSPDRTKISDILNRVPRGPDWDWRKPALWPHLRDPLGQGAATREVYRCA